MILDRYAQALQQMPQRLWSGRISKAVAGLIESVGPHCALGDCCLIRDHAGNVYGTTNAGGTGNCFNGCGTVFMLRDGPKTRSQVKA